MKQKLFTLFLALLTSVSAIYAQSGTCGDNLTWTLSNGTLTISGTGAMADYSSYTDVPWYYDRSSIQSIVISDSVTSIGISAFRNCSSLTSVTIPNRVTSIGRSAFNGCSSLTSVTIGVSVTSIGDFAFFGCSSLTSVTINSDAIVTSSYNLSDIFGSQVTKYIIGDNVKGIGNYAFSYCSSLTSITIPNSVTSIGSSAFYNCSSLTSVTIPNSVTSIGYEAFRDCSSLTSITIPNGVTSIGSYAFCECSSLTSVTIPNSVTSIGHAAFGACSSLTSVINYATQPQQVIDGRAFSSVNLSPCQLYVPSTSVGLYQTAYEWKDFGNIQPIRAEDTTDVSETIITPSENEVEITWPTVSGAASYELVIKDKDRNIVCTLIFNANGQLTSIAFNAPSRNGAPAQTQNAGFSFTITGLDSGTGYDLTLTAKDNSGNTIEETTIPFQTNKPEGIEDVQSDEVQSTKVVKDGQVFILRNGKTYTMQGQEVK